MLDEKYVAFLRGVETPTAGGDHPILELSVEELQRVIGGDDEELVMAKASKGTGSYGSSGACCDGTKVCCM
jgi:hypothetical protein